jgi:hypothetical protein
MNNPINNNLIQERLLFINLGYYCCFINTRVPLNQDERDLYL